MHIHKFKKFLIKDYEVCNCGTFHSLVWESPKKIYEENPYWSNEKGHSTPDEQIGNLTETETCGISKADKVMKYVPQGVENVLEIACFPGVVLKKLIDNGHKNVFGVEPSKDLFGFLFHQAPQAILIHGFFPECTKQLPNEYMECIIGMDVFEHIPDYHEFIMETYRLLKVGGTVILMSPIDFGDGFRDRDLAVPLEHIWMFSKNYLDPYLKSIFRIVIWDRWIKGHELIILIK